MNILFSSMPIELFDNSDIISMRTVPTTAIYLLSAVIRENGYSVEILDPYIIKKELADNTFNSIMRKALEGKDILCLSSNTLNWPMTIEAIKVVRELKGDSIIIVLGGLHPTYCYKYIYSKFDVDYILIGEGEETIIDLLHCIENNNGFESVDGLIVKNREKKELKNIHKPQISPHKYYKLPLPAFDMLPDQAYYALPIETSRGCKYNCSFCSIAHRNNWREFNEELVINRTKKIITGYQNKFINKEIFITDDCLTADLERADRILRGIIDISAESKIMLETRITDWKNEIESYKSKVFSFPQITRLGFGIECGYNEGLLRISKGFTIEILEKTLVFLEKNKLIEKAFFSFIIGFPWETMDECLKTIEYAASIVVRYGQGLVNLNWLWLFPSRLWEKRRNYNIFLSDSVFDDPNYRKQYYFKQTHPKIRNYEYQYINDVIKDYEKRGIYLRNY